MITYTKGDLLKEYRNGMCDVIAHCANCQRVMGSGIAYQIKNEMPEAYNAYIEFDKDEKELQLGTISYAPVDHGIVVNLHAQHLYGYDGSRFVNYEAIYATLMQTRDLMLDKDLKIVGVPYKMACDRAGGDWRIISAMLEVIFENTGIEVLVVEYSLNP
jgi:O-acetyl-ADP-ribose deacetylase (regulator of RNase III)